jgi:hypothetical protein
MARANLLDLLANRGKDGRGRRSPRANNNGLHKYSSRSSRFATVKLLLDSVRIDAAICEQEMQEDGDKHVRKSNVSW